MIKNFPSAEDKLVMIIKILNKLNEQKIVIINQAVNYLTIGYVCIQ